MGTPRNGTKRPTHDMVAKATQWLTVKGLEYCKTKTALELSKEFNDFYKSEGLFVSDYSITNICRTLNIELRQRYSTTPHPGLDKLEDTAKQLGDRPEVVAASLGILFVELQGYVPPALASVISGKAPEPADTEELIARFRREMVEAASKTRKAVNNPPPPSKTIRN